MTDAEVSPSAAASASGASLAAAEARDDRMPRGIPFIVANEFAERFCYYGINAILTIYMTQFLRIGDADATTYHSLFKSAAYFSPLVGAIVSDVVWGKYRTIMTFSMVYCAGCTVLALVPGTFGLLLGLGLVAFGTGGIKPCVSTNVGDQFTSKNQHLIERAFSYFYLAINAGSSISIFFCPVLLAKYGPRVAFGMPAAMMFVATIVFWLGRNTFAVVPPAGRAWLEETGFMWVWQRGGGPRFLSVLGVRAGDPDEKPASPAGLKIIGSLAVIYLFVAVWWALWDQSNGQTWTLQAESSLMDKNIGFGFTILPAQIQVVNGLFILALVPVFTLVVYPVWARFTRVTPLRKIAVGLLAMVAAFLIVGRIEGRIQAGVTVSVWWQVLAYVVLTASEVLVSITALEFSYKQAPLRMKSFIMALFLVSTSVGNLITAGVNHAMVRPLQATSVEVGADTWVTLDDVSGLVTGQKVDFDGANGVSIARQGKPQPLKGTFLVAKVDGGSHRIELMDAVDRKPVASTGVFEARREGDPAKVSTYRLVGPVYFDFFAIMMLIVAVLFILVAVFYKEKTYVRDEGPAAPS
jgi:POT family proton-dependent oligopeptide transporter